MSRQPKQPEVNLRERGALPAPASEVGVWGWVRHNLFSTWYNVVLTLGSLALIYVAVTGLVAFVLEASHDEWSLGEGDYRLVEDEDGSLALYLNNFARFNALGIHVRVDYTLDGQAQTARASLDVEGGQSLSGVPLGPAGVQLEVVEAKAVFNRWEVVPYNLTLFMVGRYPRDQLDRIWWTLYLVGGLLALSAGAWGGLVRQLAAVAAAGALVLVLLPFGPAVRWWLAGLLALGALGYGVGHFLKPKRLVVAGWTLSLPIVILILAGLGTQWLPSVNTRQWGGLTLTFLLAIVGILFSFPLGILLALGRRSKFPVISVVCVLYIELIRGVPLITILFMSRILIPLFLPGFRIEEVVSAMAGITLFSAAYMAENVRGGLQSIPSGQYEAAYAVGLNGWQSTLLIVLPQALRAVIPAIVGQFIALFKDTTLVAIIGLFDFLLIGQAIVNNRNWLGLWDEVLVFVAAVYWVFTYGMSFVSRRIEAALGVGQR